MISSVSARPHSWSIARPPRRRALISLTPLIDVVFILLVFFMLAASFLDWRSIELTAPSAGAPSAAMEGAVLVEVRSSDVRLSGQVLPPGELEARIRARLAEKPDRAVFVKPAGGVPLRQAVAVLDRLVAAGATNLSLIRGGAQ